ncbi:hypothetical protein ACFY7H_26925 [Streptomyces sp. NPDC012794]|uniref:hypothetical protein n=1 Tax=Streptomyces sp. NPDC012794 TaxID=3364850 RepID=UPI0036A8B192
MAGLDPVARRQLVCSDLSTLAPAFDVVLRGSDTALEAARCETGGGGARRAGR